MIQRVERISRIFATLPLFGAALALTHWGVHVGGRGLPFFIVLATAWMAAGVGVLRQARWGPGFAAGLSLFTIVALSSLARYPEVAAIIAALGVTLASLALRSYAAQALGKLDGDQWRFTAMGLAAGMALPFIVIFGLLPSHFGPVGVVGRVGTLLALFGMAAAFRSRTWGLFAMVAAAPLIVFSPVPLSPCGGGLHNLAGDGAGMMLLLAAGPFVPPIARFLRAKAA